MKAMLPSLVCGSPGFNFEKMSERASVALAKDSLAKEFSRATDVTSLAVTKLDGTAKGGVVIGIVDQFRIPIKFIGIGEGIDDLKVFDRKEFVNSLFSREDLGKKDK